MVIDMKAQVFLIISVIVLLGLILLKVQTTTESKQSFYLGNDIGKNIDNIINEYKKTIDISLSQSNSYQNLETNMLNFSNLTYNAFNKRSYNIKIIYSTAFIGNNNLTITLGNFLGSTIYNISMNISDGQNTSFSNLPTGAAISKNFSLPTTFNISLKYTSEGMEKNFTYTSDKNVTVASYIKIYLSRDNSLIDNEFRFNKSFYKS